MGKSVRRVSRSLLSATHSTWESDAETLVVDEYMYDPRAPRIFHVYPPNDGQGAVRAIYSEYPAELLNFSALDDDWASQLLPVPDEYAEALGHFVLHRAFSIEAEWATDPVRAKQHFELYLELVNTKAKADAVWSAPEV